MIRIGRPKRVPAVLKKRGAEGRKSHRDAFANGSTTFEFESTIYGHATVKRALVKAQYEKCCFCESRVTHISSGHIEHFRPKGGVRQHDQEPLETPGYFWLAYEWTNLLFCCEICNSRHKKNLFPLADPRARARTPDDDLTIEEAMFIDPAREDPEAHIGFREEYPFAINGSPRGEATWRALGLDREQLAEVRRTRLAIVRVLTKVRDGTASASLRSEADELLSKMTSNEGEWSAMVRAATSGRRTVSARRSAPGAGRKR